MVFDEGPRWGIRYMLHLLRPHETSRTSTARWTRFDWSYQTCLRCVRRRRGNPTPRSISTFLLAIVHYIRVLGRTPVHVVLVDRIGGWPRFDKPNVVHGTPPRRPCSVPAHIGQHRLGTRLLGHKGHTHSHCPNVCILLCLSQYSQPRFVPFGTHPDRLARPPSAALIAKHH